MMGDSTLVLAMFLLALCNSSDAEWRLDKFAALDCEGKAYNKFTHFCCADKLYERTGFNDCCLDEMYDTRTAYCWLGFHVASYMRDCRGKQFHTVYEMCCGDEVMQTWDPTRECCSGMVIDTTRQECDFGHIRPL